MEAEALRTVVGRRVRELREDAGLRQQDVAAAVRGLGLRWMRTKVAAVERGDKAVGVEDLVLLAAALTTLTARSVTAMDLIYPDVAVELTDVTSIGGEDLRAFLGGAALAATAGEAAGQIRLMEMQGQRMAGRVVHADGAESIVWTPKEDDPQLDSIGELLGVWGTRRALAHRLHRLEFTEADERAARRLELGTLAFAYVCAALWGRTLSAERDQRLEREVRTDVDPRQAAQPARRGHITRTLLQEAWAMLDQAGMSPPPLDGGQDSSADGGADGGGSSPVARNG